MSEDLVPRPVHGRTFTAGRRVRLGDVSPGGRLRLDAVARFLQDVSSDDPADAALAAGDSWVVRRTVVEIVRAAVFREWLELTTWCSATGSHWAERRVSVAGDLGASIEAATLWVFVDPDTGRPLRLPDDFDRLFGEAAGGRRVGARLVLPAEPAIADARRPWPLRFADYDVLCHVNNAAYWVPVEEELARRADLRAPMRATLEYGAGIPPQAAAEVVVADEADALSLWLTVAGRLAAAARVVRV